MGLHSVGAACYDVYMNLEDAIEMGFNPGEDYTPHPMSLERYLEWCDENGITPNPSYGVSDSEPPF